MYSEELEALFGTNAAGIAKLMDPSHTYTQADIDKWLASQLKDQKKAIQKKAAAYVTEVKEKMKAEEKVAIKEKAAAEKLRSKANKEWIEAEATERIRVEAEKEAEQIRVEEEKEAERIRIVEEIAAGAAAWEASNPYVRKADGNTPNEQNRVYYAEDVYKVTSVSTVDSTVTVAAPDGTANSEHSTTDGYYTAAAEEDWQLQKNLKDALSGIQDGSLSEVSLKNANLGDAEAVLLADALVLGSNSAVTRIDLSYNEIGERGGIALAESMSNNSASNVEIVYLRSNDLGDRGGEAVARMLTSNTKMRKIALSNNAIGDAGATALFNACAGHLSLEMLNLHKNNVGDDSMQALSNVLSAKESSVAQINISNNSIGDRGANYLSRGLETCSTVTHVDLRHNQIGDTGASTFFRAIAETNWDTDLEKFDLEGNAISKVVDTEAGGFEAAAIVELGAKNCMEAINIMIDAMAEKRAVRAKALDWQAKWPFARNPEGKVARVTAVSIINLEVSLAFPDGSKSSKDTIDECSPGTKAAFYIEVLWHPGTRVVRSTDWCYQGDPDGAAGMQGTVVHCPAGIEMPLDASGEPVPGFVCVLWDHTQAIGAADVGIYMCGYENKYTLQFADSANNDWLNERAIVYDPEVVKARKKALVAASEKAKARAQRKASRALSRINNARIENARNADNEDIPFESTASSSYSQPLAETLARKVSISGGYSSSKLSKAIAAHGSLIGVSVAIVVLFVQVILLSEDRTVAKTNLSSIGEELLEIDPSVLNMDTGSASSCTTPLPFCCSACTAHDLNCSAGCVEPTISGFQLLVTETYPGTQQCCPGPYAMVDFTQSLNLMFSLTLVATIVAIMNGIHHAFKIVKGEKTQKVLAAEAEAKRVAAVVAAAAAAGVDAEGNTDDDDFDGLSIASSIDAGDVEEQAAEMVSGIDSTFTIDGNRDQGKGDDDVTLMNDPLDASLFHWKPVPCTSWGLFFWRTRVLVAGPPAKIQNHANFNALAPIGSISNPVQTEYVPKDVGILFYVLPAVNFAFFIFIKSLEISAAVAGDPISCFGCAGSSLWSEGLKVVDESTERAGHLGTALTVASVVASLFTFVSVASRDSEETFYSAFKDSLVDLAESLGLIGPPPPAQPLQPAMTLNTNTAEFSISCHPFDKASTDDGDNDDGRGDGNVATVPASKAGVLLVYTLDGSRPSVDAKFTNKTSAEIGPDNVKGTIVQSTATTISAAEADGLETAEIKRCRVIAVRWRTSMDDGVTRVSSSNETICELNGDVLSTLPPDAPPDVEEIDPLVEAERAARLEAARLAEIARAAAEKAATEAALVAKYAAEAEIRRQLHSEANRTNKRDPIGFPLDIPGADPETMGREIARGAHPTLGDMSVEKGDILVTPGPVHRWRCGTVEKILSGTDAWNDFGVSFIEAAIPQMKCTVRYVTRNTLNARTIEGGDQPPADCFAEEGCMARGSCMCAARVVITEELVNHTVKKRGYGEDWFILWPESSSL